MPSNTVWSFSSEPSAKDTVSAFIDRMGMVYSLWKESRLSLDPSRDEKSMYTAVTYVRDNDKGTQTS